MELTDVSINKKGFFSSQALAKLSAMVEINLCVVYLVFCACLFSIDVHDRLVLTDAEVTFMVLTSVAAVCSLVSSVGLLVGLLRRVVELIVLWFLIHSCLMIYYSIHFFILVLYSGVISGDGYRSEIGLLAAMALTVVFSILVGWAKAEIEEEKRRKLGNLLHNLKSNVKYEKIYEDINKE